MHEFVADLDSMLRSWAGLSYMQKNIYPLLFTSNRILLQTIE
jgi:hypothetical protein